MTFFNRQAGPLPSTYTSPLQLRMNLKEKHLQGDILRDLVSSLKKKKVIS